MHTRPLFYLSACSLLLGVSLAARADNFVSVYYDAHTDELVVTMQFRGTNPNHEFTVQWGEC